MMTARCRGPLIEKVFKRALTNLTVTEEITFMVISVCL